jgi:hypothetical protein
VAFCCRALLLLLLLLLRNAGGCSINKAFSPQHHRQLEGFFLAPESFTKQIVLEGVGTQRFTIFLYISSVKRWRLNFSLSQEATCQIMCAGA